MHGALLEDSNSLYKLGDMYRYGRFVEKDEETAVFLYKRALRETYEDEDVYSDVCKRVGECALYGIGMERDVLKALELLSDAEVAAYKKILARDPFAQPLLPKIQQMLDEAKKILQAEFPTP